MTFRQCVIIALVFHFALMLCPLQGHIEGEVKRVVFVVTERTGIAVNSVKQEVPPEKKEKAQPPPCVVQPEKPAIEKVRREEVVRKKPPKKEKPVKDAKPETKILRSPVPPKSKPEIDVVAKHVVPEYSMQHQEAPAQRPSVAGPSIQETVTDPPLEVAFGSAEGPRFLKRMLPEYPFKERRLRKTGVVVLMLTIDEVGELIDVEILETSGTGFDDAAIAAVKNSLFIAARRNGRPVACKAMLPIRFKLR
ncbi:MAG: energy transducer TonB [Deltaproteobacteria bacterium]|nr:energy transducer TonB [Deltaproteobacteria bacterium]